MLTTPFGRLKVLDAHTHFLSRSFFNGLGRELDLEPEEPVKDTAAEVSQRLGWEEPPVDPVEIAARWVAEMDHNGVDRIIAIHTLPGNIESLGKGLTFARGRMAGFATINPLVPGAAQVLEEAVNLWQFRGVALFPAMFGFRMTDDDLIPLLDVANRHALCVFVHCGVLKVSFRQKLGLACPFDASVSSPLTLQRPAAQFPRVRFIVPHLGSGCFRELLMLADSVPNVYTDTSGAAGWAKYLDGAPSRMAVFKQALEVMGPKRILFGTDSTYFPRGWRREVLDMHLQLFEQLQLTDEEAASMLGLNLERMLAGPSTGPNHANHA